MKTDEVCLYLAHHIVRNKRPDDSGVSKRLCTVSQTSLSVTRGDVTNLVSPVHRRVRETERMSTFPQ